MAGSGLLLPVLIGLEIVLSADNAIALAAIARKQQISRPTAGLEPGAGIRLAVPGGVDPGGAMGVELPSADGAGAVYLWLCLTTSCAVAPSR